MNDKNNTPEKVNEIGLDEVVDETRDLPDFAVDGLLDVYTFKQEGELLIALENPQIQAKLPVGVRLFGERGNYKLKRIF